MPMARCGIVSRVLEDRIVVTYANGAVERVGGGEVHVDGVAKALPFFICEEIAELAEAVGNSFVGAHGLRIVNILGRPVKPVSHGFESSGCCIGLDSRLYGMIGFFDIYHPLGTC